MSKQRLHERASAVRFMALLFAGLLWLGVTLERDGELTLKAALRPEQLPAGLRLEQPLPEGVQVTVAGPRILLCRLTLGEPECRVDLSGVAGAGQVNFVPGAACFRLDRELRVLRVTPAVVTLKVARNL